LLETILKAKITASAIASRYSKYLDVFQDSITGWGNGKSVPQIRYYPKLIEFLGYNPFHFDKTTIGGWIKKYLIQHGLSIYKLSKLIEVEKRTLASWENSRVILN